jgi:hypothetical protein
MSPDIFYMRNFVANRYGTENLTWQERVSRMGDDRVMAIYFRMVQERPKPPKPPPPLEPPEIKEDDPDAPTLF